MQILSFHNAPSPAQGRRFSLLRFNEVGLPPAIEVNVGHQTKQFMSQAKFDLGPGEIPGNHLSREVYSLVVEVGGGYPLLLLPVYSLKP